MFAAGGVLRFQQAAAADLDSAPFYSLEGVGDLLAPDENGLKLPPGYRSRIVARSGVAPTGQSDYIWHPAPDGGATFATEDGGWVYVSNSELRDNAGGVGALRFNSKGEIVDAYSILSGTSVNCAGGPTPWGTWISCEEIDLGQSYECDPLGIKPAAVLPALGSFKHEAVAVDIANRCLYLTEDQRDGGFYRFRPDGEFPDLSSGTLEIAQVVSREGKSVIQWLPVPDPSAKDTATRMQVPAYTIFEGGEGLAIYDGVCYFTTKHDNRVWAYNTTTKQLDVVYDIETSSNPVLQGVDNVVITPSGDVLVAEDGGDMQIVALTADERVIPLMQVMGHEGSEVTGPAFDPSHQRLYFSSQRGATGNNEDGITYEISHSDAG
ncbi:MAG: hypothetical protein DHS20C12_19440 [Pseudohongiella sp.]|nr:MAG: hypothetical protein DHS20C12_19440 [Pseudohongiella sp.]